MRYEEIQRRPTDELERMLASGDPGDRASAIISAALHSDGKWAEEQCTLHLRDGDADVRATAALGLAHIARIHGLRNVEGTVARLTDLMNDSRISGRVSDALDDITLFERKRRGET